MGQEIADSHFDSRDFALFAERLRLETELLESWFSNAVFARTANVGGFELEAWLLDRHVRPASIIEPYLQRLENPLVVPELATFNVELNGNPVTLQGSGLRRLEQELSEIWNECNQVASSLDGRLGMFGILPTVRQRDLTLANMSPRRRYRALNEQIFNMRAGRPLLLDISGRDALVLQHDDVMLESAATSFQIHLKVNADEAGRFYNASKIMAAPMVAVSANSPFLFGRDLWAETRIPLFEQSVSVGARDSAKRVSFGIRYVRESIMECFAANLDRYPVLLPRVMEEPKETLPHVRLHNGTIWRWNRPLIGFDEDGTPHLRIEHRVVPSGPSVIDAIANAAFYYGTVCALAREPVPPESRLPFEHARDNFYTAARDGFASELVWLDGQGCGCRGLILDLLLPTARAGLEALGIDSADIDIYLGVIEARTSSGQNGSVWQRNYVYTRGCGMEEMTRAYLERQDSGSPVHEWTL